MNKKCLGCGVNLQTEDKNKKGYVLDENHEICERCFRLSHYNENKETDVIIDNDKLIKDINALDIFTFFLIDIFNINSYFLDLYQKINNPKLLVITKMDLLPKNLEFKTLAKNLSKKGIKDLCFFSVKDEKSQKELLNEINKYKQVVFVGPTSCGKSTLINTLFQKNLTVSHFHNTTQDFVKVPCDKTLIIDAPGFNFLSNRIEIKPKGAIRPKIIKLKSGYTLEVNDLKINAKKDINLTLFIVNDIMVKTYKTKESYPSVKILKCQDLVIDNIGFIYFKNATDIELISNGFTEIRESIVGKNE